MYVARLWVFEIFLGIFILHTSRPSTRTIMQCLTQKRNACHAQEISLVNVLSCSLSYSVPRGNSLYTLCFEDEGGAYLVGGLVELLGIKRAADAEGDTGAEENVVGDGCDATVVDLGLDPTCQ